MFHSHLNAPAVATNADLFNVPGMGADMSDPNAVAAAEPIPTVPAPMATASGPVVFLGMTAKQLAIMGGVAVVVFLLLKHFNKGK